MNLNMLKLQQLPSSFRNRINLFYFLAFIPLFLIFYYNLWGFVIAVYGFAFLFLKNEKLHSATKANNFLRLLGLIITISSFFAYYGLVLVFPRAGFYGSANYIAYLFGLFLVFFDLAALKQAFTPLFFIAAATSSSLVAASLAPLLSPYLDDIAALIVNILRLLGISANLYDFTDFGYSNIPIIGFTTLSGQLVFTSFAYECIGIFSAIVFSIILVIVLSEDPSSWKTKLLASVVGVLGTFALNIVRVTIIYVTDYFYGAEAGANAHYVIGYVLFSAWLALFLYVYSKRQAIRNKILPPHRTSDLSAAKLSFSANRGFCVGFSYITY
jgi:exosortase/archaeosortase family protein